MPAGEHGATAERSAAWWDVLPVALIALDSVGRIVQWAMAAEALLGYTPSEVLGRDGTEFVLPEGRPVARSLQQTVASGHSMTGAFPVRHKNGSTVELEVWACPAAGEGCRPWGLVGLAAEARALRRAKGDGALLGLFTNSPVGLAVFDTDLRFQHVNPALEAMNGMPGAAHVGRRLAEVLPGLNVEQMEAAMRRAVGEAVPPQSWALRGVGGSGSGRPGRPSRLVATWSFFSK